MKRRTIIALAVAFVTAVGLGIVILSSFAPFDDVVAQCVRGRPC